MTFMGLSVPRSSVHTFYRDLPNQVIHGTLDPLYLAIAIIVVKQKLAGADWEVAAIQSSLMAGFLTSLFYIDWGKGRSPVYLVVLPQIIARTLLLIMILVSRSWMFTAIVCATSFLNALSIPALGMVYQRNYPVDVRGKIVGVVKNCQLLGTVLAVWLVARVIEQYDMAFRWIYPLLGILGIAAIAWFSTIKCPPLDRERRRLRDIPKILREDRNFALFMLLQFIFGICNLVAVSIFYLYINDKRFLGCSPTQAAVLTGVLPALGMLTTVFLWGWIFDRTNIVRYRAITCLVMAVGSFLYAFSHDSLWVVGVGSLVWAVGRSGGTLAWTLGIFAFATREKAPIYLGIHTSLTGVRGIIAPFLGVLLLKLGGPPSLYFSLLGVLVTITAVLILVFIRVPTHGE